MSGAPADRELADALRPALGHVRVTSRRPYEYATSAPLELLVVECGDGTLRELVFKDLDPERMLPEARTTKPRELHAPARAVELQRHVLDPRRIGPRSWAAVNDPAHRRWWLICDRVDGVELWQVDAGEVWRDVARWLARFHRDGPAADDVRAAVPSLLAWDGPSMREWGARARASLAGSSDPRAASLHRALTRYDDVVDRLTASADVLLHGELYPSNVLVRVASTVDVLPIDWEMAATGPAAIDLAALVAGWDATTRRELVAAYAGVTGIEPERLHGDVEAALLHTSLLWLAWSDRWRPPSAHDHDWLGTALQLCEAVVP